MPSLSFLVLLGRIFVSVAQNATFIDQGLVPRNILNDINQHGSCVPGTVVYGFTAKWGRNGFMTGTKLYCRNPLNDSAETKTIKMHVPDYGTWQQKQRTCSKSRNGYFTAYDAQVHSKDHNMTSQARFVCNYINSADMNKIATPFFLHPGPAAWSELLVCRRNSVKKTHILHLLANVCWLK